MRSATFKISAFGDEIATDLTEQVLVLNDLKISYLELRGAWGKNVLHLSNDEVANVKRICADHNITVSAIGSPIGKSPIADPPEKELSNLTRIMQIGEMLGTQNIRVFSFYPPDTSSNDHYDDYVGEAAHRLTQLATLAHQNGFTLYLENEKDIVGDTIDRCAALLDRIETPGLEFAWDPANFVQVEADEIAVGAGITERGWGPLGARTKYVHVKDVSLSPRKVVAAGEGDGQVAELLIHLRDSGYQGFLALEPHLALAGHSSGFSGPDGMAYAAQKLRALMAKVGCTEVV